MKAFVGVPIWNRVDQIVWLIDGIIQNFKPESSVLAFLFDDCTDGSIEHFKCVEDVWLKSRGYAYQTVIAHNEVREVGGHNYLLKRFLETDCDFAIISQDDQFYKQPVAENVGALLERYPNIGIIGGRDGYDAYYRDMASSKWSTSVAVKHWLNHGEFAFKPMLNSGPIVYPRSVVEKVGFLDEEYVAFYVWDDYCRRTMSQNLVNVVMGMDIAHKKVGRGKGSTFYEPETVKHDLGRLHQKYGKLF